LGGGGTRQYVVSFADYVKYALKIINGTRPNLSRSYAGAAQREIKVQFIRLFIGRYNQASTRKKWKSKNKITKGQNSKVGYEI